MATSPRDVRLGLSVETTGQEQIKNLQASIAALAKEGGDAAPEFQALADEIGRLGAQQESIAAFRQLSDELDRLTTRQDETAAATTALAARLREASQATEAARAVQARLTEQQQRAVADLRATAGELQILRASYDAAGKKTAEYREELQRLVTQQVAQKAAVAAVKVELDAAKASTGEAASAQASLEKAYNKSNEAAERAATAARAQAEVVAQAARSAEELGVSTANLAGSQAQLALRLAQVQAEAESLRGQLDVMAAAERDMAEATQAAARAAEEQAAAMKQVEADKAAAEARALADAERLLAAEFEFAADSARRLVAAQEAAADAAARLKREQSDEFTRKLAVAQGLLTTELQLAAAAAERAAAEQTRLDAAQEAAAESARRAAAAAAEAGQRIENAFGTVGVRSAEALQAEIAEVRAAMATLAARSRETGAAMTGAFTAGEAKIKSLELELRELNGQLTLGDRTAKLFSNSLGQIAAGNLIADAVGALVERVKDLGRAFVTVITQTESMRRGLTAVYGSAQTAREQIEFLRRTSLAAGVSMSGIADSFVRFSAATKASNIPLQVTNDLFAAVTRAGSTLGLSSERVTLALDALGQMASKGVVSMEELRQQLGDSLPGALSIAAKGLNLTDQELIKLVESGQLAARDLFPGLIEGLKSMQGESDTIVGAWGRLKTALSTAAEVGGDAGWTDVIRGGLESLRVVLGVVVVALSGFFNLLMGGARSAAAFAATLQGTGSLTEAFKAMTEEGEKAVATIGKTADAFFKSSDGATANVSALQAAAAAANANTSSTVALAAAQAQAAVASGTLTGSALGVAQANARLLASMADTTKSIEANIVASEKLQKAKQLEGAAALEAAQISGNATSIMQAQTQAAVANAEAAGVVLAARQAEVASTQALIERITALAAANGGLASDQQAMVDTLQQKLQVQQASVEKTEQERAGLLAVAEAARIAAQVYQDNSANLAAYNAELTVTSAAIPELQAALAAANVELERQNQLLRDGTGSQEAVNQAQQVANVTRTALADATQRAAEAERLYNDALADTVVNMDRKTRADSANLQLTLATTNASQRHYEVMARMALARGDEAQGIYYTIEAKNRQIEAIRLTTQIKELEAKSSIAQLEIQKQEIALNDPLRAQKLEELNIRIQLQKVKLAEAGASSAVIQGIQAEIDAIRNGNSVRASSTQNIDQNTAARYRNVDAMKAQAAAEKVTSDGFKANADGSAAGTFNNMIPISDAKAIQDKLLRGELGTGDLEQARSAVEQARNARSWLDSLTPSAVSPEARSDAEGMVRNAQQALEKIERMINREQRAAAGEGSAAAGGDPARGAGTVRVDINLGGRRSSVTVATQADAQNLTGVLRELENASGTAA